MQPVRGRTNSVKQSSAFITGIDKQYDEYTTAIKAFAPQNLFSNEQYLNSHLAKKEHYIKNRYEKKDFCTLANILNTHFAVFGELMEANDAIQKEYGQTEKKLNELGLKIKQLSGQKAKLQHQNERLKSRILTGHELHLAREENVQRTRVNIVIEDEGSSFGRLPSNNVRRLQERQGYQGYKESDLFVFRTLDEFVSCVNDKSLNWQSDSELSLSCEGQCEKPQPANEQLLKKFRDPPEMNKQIQSSTQVEAKEVSALHLKGVLSSRIRASSLPQKEAIRSSKLIEEEKKEALKLNAELQSKLEGVSPVLNQSHEEQGTDVKFHLEEAKSLKKARWNMFKHRKH